MNIIKNSLLAITLLSGYWSSANAQSIAAAMKQKSIITLHTGDAAPPIVAAKWFKGKPVTAYAPGHVYVVEFWATWCGPCRAGMPHLSEMARNYKDRVTFIGMDILELISAKDPNGDYITKVANFVKNLGDGMDYTVAADTREGTMNETWMKAAGLYGIPSSFVIDQQGKVAWIGHPGMLEDVIKLVLAGKFDETAKEKLKSNYNEKNIKIKELTTQLAALKKSGEYEKALVLSEQLLRDSDVGKPNLIMTKYDLLQNMDKTKAAKYAQEIMVTYANDPITLQSLSYYLIKSERKEDKALAVKVMEKSVARSAPDDSHAYSSLASIYFQSGAIKNAITAQEKVVAILDSSLVKEKDEVVKKANDELERYKSSTFH